jgi:tRNA nucleotidyltransferase (CCA-adding enzyme)
MSVFSIRNPDTAKELILSGNPEVFKAIQELNSLIRSVPKKLATEPKVVIVGGFVRDSILRVPTSDADVIVYGVADHDLQKVLEKEYGDRVHSVGKSFGVFKIRISEGLDLDVALPRKDSKVADGHKGFEVTYHPDISIEEEFKRRDFTINAIGFDLSNETIFDPFDGISDLQSQTLRVVDPKTFTEDPLRVYRALQFAARFDLQLEDQTSLLLKQMVDRGDLGQLPRERVSAEIEKLLMLALRPSIGFELARRLGVVEKYYPELQALVGTEQEPLWHPEGSVWIHTMMAVDQSAKITRRAELGFSYEDRLTVMLGVLCHDLGKPSTTELGEDGKIHSRGHAPAGVSYAKSLLAKWMFSEAIVRNVCNFVLEHMNPTSLHSAYKVRKELKHDRYVAAVRRLLVRIGVVHQQNLWKMFLACCESDFRGRGLPHSSDGPYEIGDLFTEAITENNLDSQESLKPLITGEDIFEVAAKLGKDIKEGPIFKNYIEAIESLRDKGKIKNSQEALVHLEDLLKLE